MAFQISDFRAMLGKYNRGSVTIETKKDGSQSLKLVNNHVFWTKKNVVQLKPEDNIKVRTDFYDAIKAYMIGRGVNIADGSDGGKFLEAIRQDLLGDKKADDLGRSDDLARIFDKLDAAMLTGDFKPKSANGAVRLTDRFLMVGSRTDDAAKLKSGGFQLSQADVGGDARRKGILANTLHAARQMLENPGTKDSPLDEKLVKLLASQTKLPQEQVKTYLRTRPESLLAGAERYLDRHLRGMSPSELQELVSAVDRSALAKIAIGKAMEKIHASVVSAKGVSAFTGASRTAAGVLGGSTAISIKDLTSGGELKALLLALDALVADSSVTKTVRMFGVDVTLSVGESGRMDARIGDVSFETFGSPKVMLRTFENALSTSRDADVRHLADIMRTDAYVGAGGNMAEGERRLRNVATAIVNVKSGQGEVELLSLATHDVVTLAEKLLSGEVKPDAVKAEIRKRATSLMYARSTAIMIDGFEKAGQKVKDRVKISEQRADPKPGLNGFAADLFCNADPVVFDKGLEKPGQRIAQTVLSHAETVLKLLANPAEVDQAAVFGDVSAEALTKPLHQVLAVLDGFGVKNAKQLEEVCGNPANFGVFAAVETVIDEATQSAVTDIETLFRNEMGKDVQKVADEMPLWQKTLDEVLDGQKNSPKSAEGRFFKTLMNEYIGRSALQEKRVMLSSLLRTSKTNSSMAEKFGALLKGAGPIFQKLMQGVPENEVPEAMRGVFADMKTNLAPIPENVVKAQLSRIVEESEGHFTSISLEKTLGSASVGQAFLCKTRTRDGLEEMCVVKMLKPDVQNRYAREVDLIRELANKVDPALAKTFESRLETIRQELNFKVEMENVKGGNVYNVQGGVVKSVNMMKGVASSMDVLVLEKAEGDTVDGYLKNEVTAKMDEIRRGCTFRKGFAGTVFGDLYYAKTIGDFNRRRQELTDMVAGLEKRQKLLVELSKRWFDEAMFGSGFFHGDLHSGNIMVTESNVTVIDYGNAMKLTKDEQGGLTTVVCAAAAGDAKRFVSAINALLKLGNGHATKLDDEAFNRKFTGFVEQVFAKGNMGDTDARLAAAINELQAEGEEVPRSIYNFILSQNRLKNSIADMTAKYEEARTLLGQIAAPNVFFNEVGASIPAMRPDSKDAKLVPTLPALVEATKRGCDNEEFASLMKAAEEKLTDELRDARSAFYQDPANAEKVEDVLLPAVQLYKDHTPEFASTLETAVGNYRKGEDQNVKKAAVRVMVESLFAIQRELLEQYKQIPQKLQLQNVGNAISEVISARVAKMGKIEKAGFAFKLGGIIGKLMDAWDDFDNIQARTDEIFHAKGDVCMYFGNSVIPMNFPTPAAEDQCRRRGANINFSAETLSALHTAAKEETKLSEEKMKVFLRELAGNLKRINFEENLAGTNSYANTRNITRDSPQYKSAPDKYEFMNSIMESHHKWLQNLKVSHNDIGASVVHPLMYRGMVMEDGLWECLKGDEKLNALIYDKNFTINSDFVEKELVGANKLTVAELKQLVDLQFTQYVADRGLKVEELKKEQEEQLRQSLSERIEVEFVEELTAMICMAKGCLHAGSLGL